MSKYMLVPKLLNYGQTNSNNKSGPNKFICAQKMLIYQIWKKV